MVKESTPQAVDLSLVARIVRSYVAQNTIGIDQLAGLIAEVHRSLIGLGQSAPASAPAPPAPAVPIRRSVQHDHVVCLECGYRGRVLRRHLRVAHGLEPAEYRVRWRLPPDHPITAPAYSERRSTMAKQDRSWSQIAGSRRVDSRSGRSAPTAAWPQTAIASRGVARTRLLEEAEKAPPVPASTLRAYIIG
jgi:predicted transcriptional regulator